MFSDSNSILTVYLDKMKNILNVIYAQVTNAMSSQIMQMNATSNVDCLFYVLGVPSHFHREYKHKAAVVSREPAMKTVYTYLILNISYLILSLLSI